MAIVRTLRKRRALVAAALMLVVGGTFGFRWLKSSRPVTKTEALERFREESAASRGGPTPSAASLPLVPEANSSDTRAVRSPGSSPGKSTPLQGELVMRPPEPGVYLWRTEGFEEAVGIRRQFPPESYRALTVKDALTYTYKHLYSSEHEEWFGVRVSEKGSEAFDIRTKVVFGPFGEEVTVTFDPPMAFVILPFEIGRSWQGTWSGSTYGDYSARTFERTTLRIEDEDVEVWASEHLINMHGEIEGKQTLKTWMSPKYRTMVREEYVVTGRLKGRPGTYHGEWTNTLLSVHPSR